MQFEWVKNPANDNLLPREQRQQRKDKLVECSRVLNSVRDWIKDRREEIILDRERAIQEDNSVKISAFEDIDLEIDMLEVALTTADGWIDGAEDPGKIDDISTYAAALRATDALRAEFKSAKQHLEKSD